MSAIDRSTVIQVISVNHESGKAKKTGNDWSMEKAQCVVSGPDGITKVGELILPKDFKIPEPGKYLAEYRTHVGFEAKMSAILVALHPWDGDMPSAKPKPSPVSAPLRSPT